MQAVSKADVHIHSKYSDRPSEWLLRRIGAPESFVEPLAIYRRCRERGMDFVTVSDHNRIEGALDIAHLAGTFLSCEVTTYFPENGAKVHCLVMGFTEAQFRDIQEVRQNIYDFQRYVVEHDIVYSLAHPLFRVNDRLTVEQLEKLLLLFNRFEGINGTRDPRAAELVHAIFRRLTPEIVEAMADRHGIAPLGFEPWRKTFTGGSDDHGGLYVASAWTETPPAATVAEFLDHIRHGRHEMAGASGTSLRLAQSFYKIASSFYKERLLDESNDRFSLLGELFRRLLDEEVATPAAASMLPQSFKGLVGRFLLARQARTISPMEQALVHEFKDLFQGENRPAWSSGPDAVADARSFHIACDISHRLSYAFVQKFLKYVREGRLIECLQTLASLGPVALAIAPYLAAFRTQHKDELFLQAVAGHFDASRHLRFKSDKKAWITDTYNDTNGVVRTIRALGQTAKRTARPLSIVTCLKEFTADDTIDVANFAPIGVFELPEYETQELAVPPFLEVIEYLEREKFSELVISTPGPMGLVGLAAARLLGLRTTGMYHTDFPRYVRHLTQDVSLERATWRFMQWFYGQMDRVYVPSEFYRRQLIDKGFRESQLAVLERGVDTELFSPARRQDGFWRRYGIQAGFNYLYVGRVSREKNVELLLESFTAVRSRAPHANLIIVGDGPVLVSLRERYAAAGIVFTGWLEGEELAAAYASADAFVFPSTTDTFGNAVLEAQASGLPAIVTNRGGPQEIVSAHEAGIVVDLAEPQALSDALAALANDAVWHAALRERAIEGARRHSWETVLETLWAERESDRDSEALSEVRHTRFDPDFLALAAELG